MIHTTEYLPTPRQLVLLAAFAAIGRSASKIAGDDDAPRTPIERICEHAAIPPERFAQWMTDDGFRDWWDLATDTVLRTRTSLVLRALTERAEFGDLAAIRLWLPRFDRLDDGADMMDRETWLQLLAELLHVPVDEIDIQSIYQGPSATA